MTDYGRAIPLREPQRSQTQPVRRLSSPMRRGLAIGTQPFVSQDSKCLSVYKDDPDSPRSGQHSFLGFALSCLTATI
jgi:hypothetical protein